MRFRIFRNYLKFKGSGPFHKLALFLLLVESFALEKDNTNKFIRREAEQHGNSQE